MRFAPLNCQISELLALQAAMQLAPHRGDRVPNFRYRGCKRCFGNTKLLRPISDLMLLFHADLVAVLRTSLHSIVCHWAISLFVYTHN
jgi:hypothetical protein